MGISDGPIELTIDASVAVNYVVTTHPYHRQARQFFAALTGVSFIAPPLFEAEADSTLRRSVYLRTLSPAAGQAAQSA